MLVEQVDTIKNKEPDFSPWRYLYNSSQHLGSLLQKRQSASEKRESLSRSFKALNLNYKTAPNHLPDAPHLKKLSYSAGIEGLFLLQDKQRPLRKKGCWTHQKQHYFFDALSLAHTYLLNAE